MTCDWEICPLPFFLGQVTYVQNTFQLSHAWEDAAILLELLYNWLGLPNPATSSTDNPPRPGALPTAAFWGYASKQGRVHCARQVSEVSGAKAFAGMAGLQDSWLGV